MVKTRAIEYVLAGTMLLVGVLILSTIPQLAVAAGAQTSTQLTPVVLALTSGGAYQAYGMISMAVGAGHMFSLVSQESWRRPLLLMHAVLYFFFVTLIVLQSGLAGIGWPFFLALGIICAILRQ